ncbi:MAG: hypothetical protein ACKOAH_03865, partial [Pirellula sp.]
MHHLIDRFEPTIGWIIDRKRAFSYFAILLTLGLGFLALALRPDDRKSSAFPTGSDAQQSLAHLDQAMNGLDVCMID